MLTRCWGCAFRLNWLFELQNFCLQVTSQENAVSLCTGTGVGLEVESICAGEDNLKQYGKQGARKIIALPFSTCLCRSRCPNFMDVPAEVSGRLRGAPEGSAPMGFRPRVAARSFQAKGGELPRLRRAGFKGCPEHVRLVEGPSATEALRSS